MKYTNKGSREITDKMHFLIELICEVHFICYFPYTTPICVLIALPSLIICTCTCSLQLILLLKTEEKLSVR